MGTTSWMGRAGPVNLKSVSEDHALRIWKHRIHNPYHRDISLTETQSKFSANAIELNNF